VLSQLLRHRRRESPSPRIALRASYDAVVGLLERQAMPAAVTPECGGWVTAVPLVHREHVVRDGELLVADLPGVLAGELGCVAALLRGDDRGAATLSVCAPSGETAMLRLPEPGSAEVDRGELRSIADLLGSGAGVDAAVELLSVHATQPSTAAWVRLAQRDRAVLLALGLPPYLADADLLGTPGDEREVLVVRAGLASVRLAASVMHVPLVTAPLADGWRLVTGRDVGDQVLPVLAGLATGRRVGILLWRQGTAAGFVAVRRRGVAEAHAWNPVWRVAGVDERGRPPDVVEEVRDFLAAPTADARTTAGMLGVDEDRLVQLRALLRRRGRIEPVLEEFAELARLPEAVLDVLAGALAPMALSGAELVEPTPAAQAIWQATARSVDPRWTALARRAALGAMANLRRALPRRGASASGEAP